MELQTFPPPHPPLTSQLDSRLPLATRELYFYKQGRLSGRGSSLSLNPPHLGSRTGVLCWVVMSFIERVRFCGVNVVSVSGRFVKYTLDIANSEMERRHAEMLNGYIKRSAASVGVCCRALSGQSSAVFATMTI